MLTCTCSSSSQLANHFFLYTLQLLSPSSDEEKLTYELWVCSSDAHHSTAAIIEYSGQFTTVEVGGGHTTALYTVDHDAAHLKHTHTHTHTYMQDIELGDSPVLSMCAAGDKMWMGFEIGCLIIFDTATKKAYAQVSQSTGRAFVTHARTDTYTHTHTQTQHTVLGEVSQGHSEHGLYPCSEEGLCWSV